MYICVAQKQTRTMFVLDFSPCLNSQKQNIRRTHNYVVAEKKVLVIFPKTDGEGILKRGDLTHSRCHETHPWYLLPLVILPNLCIVEMI